MKTVEKEKIECGFAQDGKSARSCILEAYRLFLAREKRRLQSAQESMYNKDEGKDA